MSAVDKLRRPGYAPANTTVGRRGLHTRDRIVTEAAQLFVANGYHGTSINAIAEAVGGSRATIYQYFKSKDEIFVELYRQCEPAVLEHGRTLGRLGPDVDGVNNLHQWLAALAVLYDNYAMVFLEFPGIGSIEGLPDTNAGAVSDKYVHMIADKLTEAGVSGLDTTDAAGALLRISHMVNLYRFRGMLGLDSDADTSVSLAISMQLLLFPNTPADVLATLATGSDTTAVPHGDAAAADDGATTEPATASPIRRDILVAASALFAEHGYYSVAMEDIAEAADVSRATLYRHFRTKVKILAALTGMAVDQARDLAAEMGELAEQGPDREMLHRWLVRFVPFQRKYCGVTRAWYDGTLAQQLPVDGVRSGVGSLSAAVVAMLARAPLPAGLELTVAGAIFLAVLGRTIELVMAKHPDYDDDETAALMFTLLQRALLGGIP